MKNKVVSGSNDIKMKAIKPASEVILDYQGIDIGDIQLVNGKELIKLSAEQSTPVKDIGS